MAKVLVYNLPPEPALTPSTTLFYLLNNTASLSEIFICLLDIICLLQPDCPLLKSKNFTLALELCLEPDLDVDGCQRRQKIWYMGKHLGERPETKSHVDDPQEPFIEGDVQNGKI